MKLEDRIFNFVDFGEIEFSKCYDIQLKLKELRTKNEIQDTVIFARHPKEISFGGNPHKNLFDPEFLEKISTQNEDQIIEYLESIGVKFSRNGLGGGAMAFGPGQYSYYFILNSEEITQNKDPMKNTSLIRPKYNSIMIETAREFISEDEIDETNIGKYKLEVDNTADVFVKGAEKMQKIASKGIRVGKENDMIWCIGGFTYYVDKESIEPFQYILPCGLKKDMTIPMSFEELSKKKISPENMHKKTIEQIMLNMNYSKVKLMNKNRIYQLLN